MTAVSPNLADKTRNRLGGAIFGVFPLGAQAACRAGIGAGTVAVWGLPSPLQINHPLQQILVRVAGVEADGFSPLPRAAPWSGAGDYLHAGGG